MDNCPKCGKCHVMAFNSRLCLKCDVIIKANERLSVITKTTNKSDKDLTKVRPTLVDVDFVEAIAKVFQDGIKGDRKADGWKDLEWTLELERSYFDALMRHLHSAIRDKDDEKHLLSIVTNANIIWYHRSRNK